MTPSAGDSNSAGLQKVVIQLGARTIKGHLECPTWDTVEDLLRNAPHGSPESFRIRHLESGILEEISTKNIKAVFYVDSFAGDSDHKYLNFHSRAPIVHGLWVRLQFRDGEVLEGIVYNSIHYLVDPGFFLLPTDPESNNKLVYVVKSFLADYRVLGIRKL
jgi:hypothetical protein